MLIGRERSDTPGPLGPRVITATQRGRFWEQLEVGNRLGAVPHGRAYTVISRITTADDDNILALRIYVVIILELRIQK